MKKGGKLAIGAVLVAAAGYVAGILSAPRSGRQTRKKLAKSASKARIDAEKQLKTLHGDLKNMINEGEGQLKKTKSKAAGEFKKQLDNSKKTKEKVKMLLSAIRSGEATDPDLKNMLGEAKKAKSNLAKFIKKKI